MKGRIAMFDVMVLAVVGVLTLIGFWKGLVRQLWCGPSTRLRNSATRV